MKRSTPTKFLLALGLCLVASATFVRAQYTNGQNAYILWGQISFNTSAAGAGAGNFNGPSRIATDPNTGKFFVADTQSNRVLRFPSAAAYTTGAGAEAVFGQDDFSTITPGTTQKTMNGPTGVVVDASGHLWVADTGNNRVLRFDDGSTTTDPNADGVLGQFVFDSGTATVTQSGMNSPSGLTVDANGSLYVVDKAANRILRFVNPAEKSNGALADGLFGQGGSSNSYLSNASGTTANTLSSPSSVHVDSDGNLWVADSGNNRVLLFTAIASQSTGASASEVFGQSTFTTNTNSAPPTVSSLSNPEDVSTDEAGRLYVSDRGNNRIVIYSNPTLLGNGGSASFVLGQSDFVSSGATTTQTGLNTPRGITYDSGYLWVTDAVNNRVINYALTAGTPAFSGPSKVKIKTTRPKKFTISFIARNASDVFTLGLEKIPRKTKSLADIEFSYQGQDITSELQAGTFTTTDLAVNASLPIKVTITPTSKAQRKGGNIAFTLTATSISSSSNTAQKTVNGTFKLKKQKKKKR